MSIKNLAIVVIVKASYMSSTTKVYIFRILYCKNSLQDNYHAYHILVRLYKPLEGNSRKQIRNFILTIIKHLNYSNTFVEQYGGAML